MHRTLSNNFFTIFRKADFEANDFYVAMTGDTFEWIIQYQSHMIPYILIKGTIFARMSPENKEHLKIDCYPIITPELLRQLLRHSCYYVLIFVT